MRLPTFPHLIDAKSWQTSLEGIDKFVYLQQSLLSCYAALGCPCLLADFQLASVLLSADYCHPELCMVLIALQIVGDMAANDIGSVCCWWCSLAAVPRQIANACCIWCPQTPFALDVLFFEATLCDAPRRAAHFANYAADEDDDGGALKGKEVSFC